MTSSWTYWRLAPDRYVLELHEQLTPDGCALEIELHGGAGDAPTLGVWKLEGGAVLAVVEAWSA